MRTFLLTDHGTTVGEGVEFSDGSAVLRWLDNDVVSRYADMGIVRSINPGYLISSTNMEPVSERLRRKRKAAGLSQRGLAKQLGMSFSTISRIEGGENYVMTKELQEWLDHEEWDGPVI